MNIDQSFLGNFLWNGRLGRNCMLGHPKYEQHPSWWIGGKSRYVNAESRNVETKNSIDLI